MKDTEGGSPLPQAQHNGQAPWRRPGAWTLGGPARPRCRLLGSKFCPDPGPRAQRNYRPGGKSGPLLDWEV